MPKLSGLPTVSTPALADLLAGIQSSSTTDDKITIQTLLALLAGNSGILTATSYTNTGSAGGTGYYINLGGIKICWGLTGTLSVSGSGAVSTGYTISLPTSFFSTIQGGGVFAGLATASNTQFAAPTNNTVVSTSLITFYFSQWSGSNASGGAGWLVFGT